MIKIWIPGRKELVISQVIFDYNGTLAVDGKPMSGVMEGLNQLSKNMKVAVLTADTHGTAQEELAGANVVLHRFPSDQAGLSKREYVLQQSAFETAVVGNGHNDLPMFEVSGLSIAVIGREGCNGKLISRADIVVTDIKHVFELLLRPDRIKATLRA